MPSAPAATADSIGGLFLTNSCQKLEKMADHVHTCFQKLDDELIWKRSTPVENSLANLVLHLCGNVRQWIGCYVGGLPDIRKRSEEFAARDGGSGAELLAQLDETVRMAVGILQNLAPERLVERVAVQDGQTAAVLEAIYHVVGHFQQHVGQIIYATKLWTAEDLALYRPSPHPAPTV
jgi:uncharacterized damage-inducible protein DinB